MAGRETRDREPEAWNSRTLALEGGRSLHLVQAGGGPDLLLIHGALTTHHDWLAGSANALARDHRVTIVDRPGHGLSVRPRFVGTPREQARQIVDGLDLLGIQRTAIAAHSFGGMVSLALAEHFPERVRSLLLLAPIGLPEVRLIEHLLLAPRAMPFSGPLLSSAAERSQFDRSFLNFVQRLMFSPEPVPPAWRDSFPFDQVLDRDTMVAEGEDTASIFPFSPSAIMDYRRISAPIGILAGTSDLIVDKERQGRPLSLALPNARFRAVEGAGHMLHHSHPHLIVDALAELAEAEVQLQSSAR